MDGQLLTVSALGVSIGLDLSSLDAESASVIENLWEPASTSDSPVLAVGVSVLPRLSNGEPRVKDLPRPDQFTLRVSGDSLRSLASNLSSRVTLTAIEERRHDLLMLHACGVATPDGRVMAFVGPSGRGKTTLASQAALHFAYVTDETIGIEADGTVQPYRKPLSVIVPGSDDGIKTQMSSDELGLLPLPTFRLSLRGLALINRQSAWLGDPEVTEVDLIDALVRLIPEMSYLPELPRPLQRVASAIDDAGGVVRITYRESSDVAALIPALLERAPTARSWTVLSSDDQPSAPRPGHYTRAPVLDGIASGGTYVLLNNRDLRVLEGIGPAIWDALASPATIQDITSAVVLRFGAPDGADPHELVRAALIELMDAELVHLA